MLQHATRDVSAERLDDCVAFYALLGFVEVPTPAGIGTRARWLQRGPTQIHLMVREDARPQAGHLGVVVGDYEATVGELSAAGHHAEARPEHWGSPRAYVRDPAGNLVELMASPPPG